MKGYAEQVRPGVGITTEQVPINPIRSGLVEGTYQLDAAQQAVDGTCADPVAHDPERMREILNMPENKGFRNAYASLVIDNAYGPYVEAVAGPGMGLHGAHFDASGRSFLIPVPLERLDGMSAAETAGFIAASNQQTFAHFICEEFRGGRVPVISGVPKVDAIYSAAFLAQTELVMRSGRAFQIVPETAGPQSSFITSGIEVARMYIFGLPNIITGVSERDGLGLSPAQHRRSFQATTQKVMPPYFIPSLPIVVALNLRLVIPGDPNRTINPATYRHNGNTDELTVFPDPEIMNAINIHFGAQQLPPQTTCPAFRSRLETVDEQGGVHDIPLPRSLPEVALRQLDAWYYPKLLAEQYA